MFSCVKKQEPEFDPALLNGSAMANQAPKAVASGSHRNNTDIIDLEQIVLQWAKKIFDVTKTKSEGKVKKKHLQYNINWSHMLSETLEPIYTVDGVDNRSRVSLKDEVVLFKTTFTNTTDREQEYSFKTERVTRSAATVIVEKGICRGVDMSLKLKTPCEVVEANAGFKTELSVMHIGENTTEEELAWGVDSTVRVPPRSETVAQLVILEDNKLRKFSIENQLTGKIVVTLTNLKENNSLVTVIDGNIADIIRGLPNYMALGFRTENQVVSYTTSGSCRFKYGIEQRVTIKEKSI